MTRKDVSHGTRTRYVYYGCRCDSCRHANRVYQRKIIKKLAKRNFNDIPHGLGGYCNYRCRCTVCKSAVIKHNRILYKRYKKNPPPCASHHGTTSAYQFGCRCAKCRKAGHKYYLKYKGLLLKK